LESCREGGAARAGGSPVYRLVVGHEDARKWDVPASYSSNGFGSGVRVRFGQLCVADGGVGGDVGRELPDGNITVESGAREAGVGADRGNLDENTSGCAVLQTSQSRLLRSSRELGTYERSSADTKGRCLLVNRAVSSCDDCVGIQQRTTAEVGATLLERHDEGEVASGSGLSTYDLGDLMVQLWCRKGCGENDCGNRKSEECVNHCDSWVWE
jgi:hypothetical protein